MEDLACRTHRQVEQEAFEKITGGLTPTQRAMIDTLLQPSTGGEDRTLTWLRRLLGSPGV